MRLEARQARAKAEKKAKSEAKKKLKAGAQDLEAPTESIPSQSSVASVSSVPKGSVSSATAKFPSSSKLIPTGAAGSSKMTTGPGSKLLPGKTVTCLKYVYNG